MTYQPRQPNSLRSLAPSHRAIGVALVLFALLLGGAHAQVPPNPFDYTRTSSFEYDATTGLLTSETVEPDNLASCVKTTYALDTYGNRRVTTVANCAGTVPTRAQFTTRSATAEHAPGTAQTVTINGASVAVPQGAFPITVTNALSQSENKTFDPRFGAVMSLTGPNALITSWQYDDFGRKTAEIRADNTRTVWFYCFISGRVSDSNSNTSGCPLPGASEIPADAVHFVHSEPRNTGNAKMGAFTRVYSDRLGRTLRSVTEAFNGASQPAAPGTLIVQDIAYNAFGARVLETQPYFLATNSSTTGGNGDMGIARTDYDALGRPTDIYVADPVGTQSGVTFGIYGSRTAARTSVTYNGLTTTTTNDKGQTQVHEKNPRGKLTRATDAQGAQLVHQYDAFDNLVQTKDALGNQTALQYDLRGRKTQLTDPDTGIWQYDYNALGELVWQQSPNQRALAQQTTMAYDVLGRLISRSEPEYNTTWTYDKYANNSTCTKGIGKLCEVTSTNGVNRKLKYDSLGRPINARTTITSGPSFAAAVTYSSTTGRLATQTYPTGLKVDYTYTSKGFLEKLRLVTAATVNPLPATAGGTAGASTSLPANTVLWQAKVLNAWGRLEQQSYSNGVLAQAAYQAATGRTTALTAGTGGSNNVLNHSFGWDNLGNLASRADNIGDGSGAVTESFIYDSINRLTQYDVSSPAIAGLTRRVTMQYNALGSLLYKSDVVGAYTYNASGSSSVRPHALASLNSAAVTSYGFDANGNLTSASGGKYTSLSYTSFNLPDAQNGILGAGGSTRTTWQYDENHARIKEVRTITGGTMAGTRTTWALHPDNAGGLSFEHEVNAPTTPSAANPAATSNRHYLSAGSMTVGVLVSTGALPALSSTATAPPSISSITLVKVEYWHKDHLGSLAATTDHAGAVTARMAYDPFGKRRTAGGVYDLNGTLVIDYSAAVNHGADRGFTGHEHLDELGLIHMNGRIYDPLLGLFVQADPLIQAPGDLQSFNRYSYVMNNPLAATDPSGYFSWRKFFKGPINVLRRPSLNSLHKWIHSDIHFQIGDDLGRRYPIVGQVGTIVVTAVVAFYCSPCLPAIAGSMAASTAYAQGAETSEYWRAGVIAAGTAYAGQQLATYYNSTPALSDYWGDVLTPAMEEQISQRWLEAQIVNAAGRAAIGCASASAAGGDCKRAALFGASTALMTTAFRYVQGITDDLKLRSCFANPRSVCEFDERGVLRADGSRVAEWGTDARSLLKGMEREGSGRHYYDPGQSWGWCSLCRYFATDTSKVHDWFNSWAYSSTGQYIGMGLWGNTAFDAFYSLPGMLPAAGITAGHYLGSQGLFPSFYPGRRGRR